MTILVNVAAFEPHPKFYPDFCRWFAQASQRHDLQLHWPVSRGALHHQQNRAVEAARASKATHILWIEDDHWGFPDQGLDHLLEENKGHIGLWTYSKSPPYKSFAMKKVDPERWSDFRTPSSCEYRCLEPDANHLIVRPVDLIPWGFTLTNMEVFDLIHNPFESWHSVPTDTVMCERMLGEGLQPWISFKWAIAHGDITPPRRQAELNLMSYASGELQMSESDLKYYLNNLWDGATVDTTVREWEKTDEPSQTEAAG